MNTRQIQSSSRTMRNSVSLVLVAIFAVGCSTQLPQKCLVLDKDKIDCGYAGIPEDYCRGRGCCYDNSTKDVPWCYKASTDIHLTTTTLFLLARDGVPFDVLASLYADSVPGSEWLMAFKDGKLDTTRLLELISGTPVTVNPYLGDIAAGKSPLKRIIHKIASMRGLDPTYLELLLEGNTKALLKHLIALTYARRNYTTIPYETLHRFFTDGAISGTHMVYHYADVLFQHQNLFKQAFFRAYQAGEMSDAIHWAYLASLSDRYSQGAFYPRNAELFASLVEKARTHPGSFSPSTLNAIERGKLISPMSNKQTFKEVFGRDAYEYVCASHSAYLETPCKALIGRYIVTNSECQNVGCCLKTKKTMIGGKTESRQICFENYLGNVGLILSKDKREGSGIVQFFLNAGRLRLHKAFIPWKPNNNLPAKFTRFDNSKDTDIFINNIPTSLPLKASKRRPNFVWKPHGPTAFPFATQVPEGFLVPTDESLIQSYGGIGREPESSKVRNKLTLGLFKSSCNNVKQADRYPCIGNAQAFAPGGRDFCLENKCCYDPDWRNLTITACFRRGTYGQCYLVEPHEREECGYTGISKTACLENTQCCYDSAVSTHSLYNRIPWCYYKKYSPVKEDNRCGRNIAYEKRRGCFLNYNFNFIVTQKSCEAVEGCCYEKVQLSWFDRTIGRKTQPPYCYKGRVLNLSPTVARPIIPTKSICQYQNDMRPDLRAQCGTFTDKFTCIIANCCWEPLWYSQRYSWCFKKSNVSI